jgi:hypothetical protein
MKFGIATAAKMAMMATTIMISTRVKPFSILFMVVFLSVLFSFPDTMPRQHPSAYCVPTYRNVAKCGRIQ